LPHRRPEGGDEIHRPQHGRPCGEVSGTEELVDCAACCIDDRAGSNVDRPAVEAVDGVCSCDASLSTIECSSTCNDRAST
jgi:hypothetical protein